MFFVGLHKDAFLKKHTNTNYNYKKLKSTLERSFSFSHSAILQSESESKSDPLRPDSIPFTNYKIKIIKNYTQRVESTVYNTT